MRRIVSCLHCLIFLFSCFPPLLANLVYPETTGRRCRRKAPSVYPGEKWRSTGCAARAACPLPPDCLVLLYVCMQFSVVMCFFSSFPVHTFIDIRRDNRPEMKKAGNLRYAFARTSGEAVVIFDADFCPRWVRLSLPVCMDACVSRRIPRRRRCARRFI